MAKITKRLRSKRSRLSRRARRISRRSRRRASTQRRKQRGGMYATEMGKDRIPVSEGDDTVVIKTIEGVPTSMSAETYSRDYKATGEDVGQI
jgi:hypothetical protein